MSDGPDLGAALAVLDADERGAIASLAATLGAGDWHSVSGLRTVALAAATLRVAEDVRGAHPRLSEIAALREATRALGFPDPGTAAETVARQVRRWRASGQDVRNAKQVA